MQFQSIDPSNSDNCGCDNDFYSVINSSPILSGSQEDIFNPQVLNNTNNNNNNSNNIKKDPIIFDKNVIPKIDLEVLQQKKINNNNIEMNIMNNANMNNANMNNPNMNNANMNIPNMNNANMNIPNMNNANMNNANMNNANMNNPNMNNANMNNPNMNNANMNNPNMNNANMNNPNMNNANIVNDVSNNVEKENKNQILFNYNYVLLIMVSLAWNDIIKFYINRSIKFNNGTHHYYLYYGITVTLLIFITSKLLQKM